MNSIVEKQLFILGMIENYGAVIRTIIWREENAKTSENQETRISLKRTNKKKYIGKYLQPTQMAF